MLITPARSKATAQHKEGKQSNGIDLPWVSGGGVVRNLDKAEKITKRCVQITKVPSALPICGIQSKRERVQENAARGVL